MFGIPIKFIIYFGAAAMAVLFVWKIYGVILDNGKKDIIIQSQTEQIKTLKDSIKLRNDLDKLKDDAINQRDEEIAKLENQLDSVTVDLPQDSADQAPESIKEVFRRLSK